MTTYRLLSSPAVSAPGIIRWAMNGYHFKRDRPQLRKVVSETWSIPAEAADALLCGDAAFTVDDSDEAVVFDYFDAAARREAAGPFPIAD